jgi:hypothetical protein
VKEESDSCGGLDLLVVHSFVLVNTEVSCLQVRAVEQECLTRNLLRHAGLRLSIPSKVNLARKLCTDDAALGHVAVKFEWGYICNVMEFIAEVQILDPV